MTTVQEEQARTPEASWRGILWHSRWAVMGVALAAVVGIAVGKWQGVRTRQAGWEQRPLEGLQVFWTVPDFSLVERSGRAVTLAELRGGGWVAGFIYTPGEGTGPLPT